MEITIDENEKKLILWLLGQVTIKAVDTEAVPVSIAAQSLLVKLSPPPQLEVVPEDQAVEEVA